MSADEFCLWLQGFFDLSESGALSEKQVEKIKSNLKLTFDKTTKTIFHTRPHLIPTSATASGALDPNNYPSSDTVLNVGVPVAYYSSTEDGRHKCDAILSWLSSPKESGTLNYSIPHSS